MTSTRIQQMIADANAAHRAALAEKIRQADDVTIVCEFVPGFDEPGFDVAIHGGPNVLFGTEILWDLPGTDAVALLVDGGYRSELAERMVGQALRVAQYEMTR